MDSVRKCACDIVTRDLSSRGYSCETDPEFVSHIGRITARRGTEELCVIVVPVYPPDGATRKLDGLESKNLITLKLQELSLRYTYVPFDAQCVPVPTPPGPLSLREDPQ